MFQCYLCIILKDSEPLNYASCYSSGLSSIFNRKCWRYNHLRFLFFFFLKSYHNLHVLTHLQLIYVCRIIPSIFELSCFSGLVFGVFVFALGCFLGIINISEKLDLSDTSPVLLERNHVYYLKHHFACMWSFKYLWASQDCLAFRE